MKIGDLFEVTQAPWVAGGKFLYHLLPTSASINRAMVNFISRPLDHSPTEIKQQQKKTATGNRTKCPFSVKAKNS